MAGHDPGTYATVTSVVSEAEVEGKAAYKWWSEVENTNVDWIDPNNNPYNDLPTGVSAVTINDGANQSTRLGTPQNDVGWDNFLGPLGGDGVSEGTHWLIPDPGNAFVPVGGVGHFWYFTEPIPIVTGTGEYFSPGVAGSGGGPALIPGAMPTVTPTAPALIPVNANNDNFREVKNAVGIVTNEADRWLSANQKFIPKRRDFDVPGPFAQPDSQLQPVTTTVTGGLAGTVTIDATPAEECLGRVKFWEDDKKGVEFKSRMLPGGANPAIFRLFVEGCHESPMVDDVRILTRFSEGFFTVSDTDYLSVTPTFKSFAYRVGGPKLTIDGNTPTFGLKSVTSAGVPDAQGKRANGIEFQLGVERGVFGTLDVQFFQNQNTVTNGFNTPAKTGPGQVFAPPGAPQSLLLTQAAVNAGAAFPLLDAKTGSTFYPTFTLANGDYITQDTPRLHVGNSVGQSLTILYVFEIFTMYFVVVFPEQSIYAIANCH